MAGARNMKSSGMMPNRPRSSACFSMNSWVKNRQPAMSVKTVTTMYATGELK